MPSDTTRFRLKSSALRNSGGAPKRSSEDDALCAPRREAGRRPQACLRCPEGPRSPRDARWARGERVTPRREGGIPSCCGTLPAQFLGGAGALLLFPVRLVCRSEGCNYRDVRGARRGENTY
ncbi:hypothetical protein AAFF_G00370070 [Aldrovandia affinis]|uniref:Uncharacterized protein n=1 Tax=Aldrovandia affinis TaxID=143900 RepID=A0AAD7SH23_9TELE|nr:hypothetical protein AAFF_G00370070 [Aldrovandia affinis]